MCVERLLPACTLMAMACLAAAPAGAGEQRVAFAVTIQLKAAPKARSPQELCRDTGPLDTAAVRQQFGGAIRVDCPPQPVLSPAPETLPLSGERGRPPEVMVSY